MQLPRRVAALAPLAAFVVAIACSGRDVVAPPATLAAHHDVSITAVPSVYISELHYDNVGTDANEAIEINAPAGTDLTNWQVVLYNGSRRRGYNTRTLSGTVPATCDTRGVIVLTYPQDGIQNGSPDGIALVNAAGTVIEFLSYEGSFTAVGGAGERARRCRHRRVGERRATRSVAAAQQRRRWSAPADEHVRRLQRRRTDRRPRRSRASPSRRPPRRSRRAGRRPSRQRRSTPPTSPIAGVAFTWTSSATSIATVNASGVATGVAPGDATITATAPNGVAGSASLHVDAPADTRPAARFGSASCTTTTSAPTPARRSRSKGRRARRSTGWSIVLYNGNGGLQYNTQTLSGTIAESCSGRGVVVVTLSAGRDPERSPDGLALVNASGEVVEFLSYEGTFAATDGPAAGKTATDIGVSESSSPIGAVAAAHRRPEHGSRRQRRRSAPATDRAAARRAATRSRSRDGRRVIPRCPSASRIRSSRRVRDPSGATIVTTVTWTSETPAIASIDQNGVFTALAAGTATFRATRPTA